MPNKKDWEEEFREIARTIWRHRNEIEMEDALIGKINSLLAAKDQEIKQVKEEVINFMINYYHPGGTPDEVKEEKKKILKFLNKDLWKKKLNHY